MKYLTSKIFRIFLKFLKTENLVGLNVTIPYKEQIIPYLDELSEEAQRNWRHQLYFHQKRKNKGFQY